MKRYLAWFSVASAALVLAACGSSTSGFSLSGVVATGAPAVGATVKLKDANDVVLTATTDSNGSYTVTSSSAPTAPVLLQASLSDGSTLHSVLETLPGAGEVANVTPATEAVVAQVVGDDPATVFDKAKASRSISASDVTQAKANLRAALKDALDSLGVSSTSYDPIKNSFSANGTGADKLLDLVSFSHSQDASTSARVITIADKADATKKVTITRPVTVSSDGKTTAGTMPSAPDDGKKLDKTNIAAVASINTSGILTTLNSINTYLLALKNTDAGFKALLDEELLFSGGTKANLTTTAITSSISWINPQLAGCKVISTLPVCDVSVTQVTDGTYLNTAIKFISRDSGKSWLFYGNQSSTLSANDSRGINLGIVTGNSYQYTAAIIQSALEEAGLLSLTGAPVCDVKYSKLKYYTVNGKGERVQAAAVYAEPSGTDAKCTASKLLVHTHGTQFDKDYDYTSLSNVDVLITLGQFAAQGYAVLTPAYVGYSLGGYVTDPTSLAYHPYQVAKQQSDDVIDAMRAARAYKKSGLLGDTTKTFPSKIFLAGLSQGGYVAMATQRALESTYAREFTLTASAPMSGPYALAAFGDVILKGQENEGATLFLPMLMTAYQQTYGDVYSDLSDWLNSPFIAAFNSLPKAGGLGDGNGFAPALLPTTATNAGYPAEYSLLKQKVVNDWAAAIPDLTKNMKQRMLENDLLNFAPKKPTYLCYSANDPVVFGMNTTKAVEYFAKRGKTVPSYDLTAIPSTSPFAAIGTAFVSAYPVTDAVAANGSTPAVAARTAVGQVHGETMPFCMAIAKAVFDQM